MMRSHTTTPRVAYWCSMDTKRVETVAAAAEIVVFTAIAALMLLKPLKGPRIALAEPGLKPAGRGRGSARAQAVRGREQASGSASSSRVRRRSSSAAAAQPPSAAAPNL